MYTFFFLNLFFIYLFLKVASLNIETGIWVTSVQRKQLFRVFGFELPTFANVQCLILCCCYTVLLAVSVWNVQTGRVTKHSIYMQNH